MLRNAVFRTKQRHDSQVWPVPPILQEPSNRKVYRHFGCGHQRLPLQPRLAATYHRSLEIEQALLRSLTTRFKSSSATTDFGNKGIGSGAWLGYKNVTRFVSTAKPASFSATLLATNISNFFLSSLS